ncbi:hypothetical protein ACET3Z_032199 [Daucus carota]
MRQGLEETNYEPTPTINTPPLLCIPVRAPVRFPLQKQNPVAVIDNARPNLIVYGESSREPPTGAYTSNGTSAKPSQRSTTNQRVLPPRANTSSTVITDNMKRSRKLHSQAAVQDRSSLDHSHQKKAGNHRSSDTTNNSVLSNLKTTQDTNSTSPARKDYDQFTSQQGSKRSLPNSIPPQVPNPRSFYLAENVGSSQMHETYGNTFSAARKLIHGMELVNRTGQGSVDKFMSTTSGSRILPLSMMHGKSTSTSQHANSVDPVFRSTTGEDRAEYDERLFFQAALQDLNQPKLEDTLPEGYMTVSLLRHQKIALAWMLQKETKSPHCAGGILADDQGLGKTISMTALILKQKFLQSKTRPEVASQMTAEALNLDDDEDNEITVLDQGKLDGESNDLELLPEARTSRQEFKSLWPQAGTLVVCPASVLRQWARELDEKVAAEVSLKVLIYHGSNRIKDPDELAAYDVVLTTYALVTNEVLKQPVVNEDDDDPKNCKRNGLFDEISTNKKKNTLTNSRKRNRKGKRRNGISDVDLDSGALARVRWFRVILDEAQTIKNHRTQVARACCSLKAKVRWCLSGSPIQNSIDELFSYFRFLRYEPYNVYKSFCGMLKHPISLNSIQGYKKLHAVLRTVMLRRTKGTVIDGEPIITLPSKTINLKKVEFSVEELAFYQRLEAEYRSQFKAYAAAGTLGQNYTSIILMLLRLRQACDHPLLVNGSTSDSVERFSSETAASIPKDMPINLLKRLQSTSAICGVCKDPPEDAFVTMCGHVFCYQCVSENLTGEDNICPSPRCKEELGPDLVFSKATLRSCISDDQDDNPSSSSVHEKSRVVQRDYISSKIKTALEILMSHCKSYGGISSSQREELSDSGSVCSDAQTEGPGKAIVFSQWIGMLDLVEMALLQTDLQYRKLDGTMTLTARDKAVREFNTDPEVTVMLMSLKAGNLGLNMVAATHVILLDLWWNPTTEDQAIDRSHGIGQTRPVTVSRITISNTVEDRILALQEEKRKMVASAFGEDQSGGTGSRLSVEDLRYLFMGN